MTVYNFAQWIIGAILILSSLGVVLFGKPVHACLSFLLSLVALAVLYLELSAQFIGVMQVLVYAGAILVIFMFVIILFQDAYLEIDRYKGKAAPLFLFVSAFLFLITLVILGKEFLHLGAQTKILGPEFGTVQSLGTLLYVDFFFPFEAVIFLFLIAMVGALYIGKKGMG